MPSGLGTVDLELPPDEVAAGFSGLRIFRGYAGWGAGQLDAELELGGWIVLAAEPEDVFTGEPDVPVATGAAPASPAGSAGWPTAPTT